VDNLAGLTQGKRLYETALRQEVKKGEALILCSVDGTCREYAIEIQEIRRNARDVNKGMILKVTDPELLEWTGGIVQGMSGSPIIQDGKLVGAVTHVLVNDPTRGYGIFIENMLDAED
jgi:stage IV sporulation protein B